MGVQVGVVEPGAVSSEFVANAGLDLPGMLADAGPYGPALQAYVQRTLAMYESGSGGSQTPDEVAAVVLESLRTVRPSSASDLTR